MSRQQELARFARSNAHHYNAKKRKALLEEADELSIIDEILRDYER